MKRHAAAAVAAKAAQPVLEAQRSCEARGPDWPRQPNWSLLPSGLQPPALLAGAAEGPEKDWRDALKGEANGFGFKPRVRAGSTVARRQEGTWLLKLEAKVLQEMALADKALREKTWLTLREEREKAREDKAKARGNKKGNPPGEPSEATQDSQAPRSEKTRAARRVDFASSTVELEKVSEFDAMRSHKIAKAGAPNAPRAVRQTNGRGRGSSDSKSGQVMAPAPNGPTLKETIREEIFHRDFESDPDEVQFDYGSCHPEALRILDDNKVALDGLIPLPPRKPGWAYFALFSTRLDPLYNVFDDESFKDWQNEVRAWKAKHLSDNNCEALFTNPTQETDLFLGWAAAFWIEPMRGWWIRWSLLRRKQALDCVRAYCTVHGHGRSLPADSSSALAASEVGAEGQGSPGPQKKRQRRDPGGASR